MVQPKMQNKTYTLKEVQETFFPGFAECSRCGGFHPKKELLACRMCNKLLCEHCRRRHPVGMHGTEPKHPEKEEAAN